MRLSRSILLSAAVTWVCAVTASSQSFVWSPDSNTGFHLGISGTGSNWSGTVTSPSGLWKVSSGFQLGPLLVNRGADVLFTISGTGITYFPVDSSLGFGADGEGVATNTPFLYRDATFVYFSFPPGWLPTGEFVSFNWSPSTPAGSWSLSVSLSGPELPVPEPNPLLLVGFAIGGLAFTHRVSVCCQRRPTRR